MSEELDPVIEVLQEFELLMGDLDIPKSLLDLREKEGPFSWQIAADTWLDTESSKGLDFLPMQIKTGDQVYLGQWRDGRRCGIGILVTLSDHGEAYIYEGSFKDDYPHGYGRKIQEDFTKGTILSEGSFANGMMHGAMFQIKGMNQALVVDDSCVRMTRFRRMGKRNFLRRWRAICCYHTWTHFNVAHYDTHWTSGTAQGVQIKA